MSREIKFRVWDNVENKMYFTGEEENIHFYFDSHGIVADRYFDAKIFTVEGDSYISGETEKLEHLKYMQYTGLKDKNGVEIYEGDIYETPNQARFIVDFSQYHNGYVAKWINRSYGVQNLFFADGIIKGEVIGNIYENPELVDSTS